jgi:signal transduction histidine kinase/Tfp pilus assembly protein PilF
MSSNFRYTQGCIFFFFLAGLVYIPSLLSAQSDKIDSLKQELNTNSMPDTSRVKTMIELTRQLYWAGRYDESMALSTEARKLSRMLHYPTGEGDAWIASGYIWLRKGDYDSAIHHFGVAHEIFLSIRAARKLANAYLFTGQAYDYLAEYDKALRYYTLAGAIIEEHPDDVMRFKILNSTGVTYFNKGSYETALEIYLKALPLSAGMTDKVYYASVVNNIGVVHMSISRYEDALRYFKLYRNTMRELKHKQSSAVALLNVGEAYMYLKQHREAILYLDSALTIYTELGDKRGISLTKSNLGEEHKNLGNYQAAEILYHEAIALAEAINGDEALIKAQVGAAEVYLKKNDLQKATAHLTYAIKTSRTIGSVLWLEKAYLLHSKIDSARGDYKAAYTQFKKYSALNDSLFNERKSQQVLGMRELYESEKKDKEIILLSEAKKREELKVSGNQKLLLVSILFFSVIIIGILYWVYIQSKHARQLTAQHATITSAYAELQTLMDKVEDQNRMLGSKNEALEDLHREKDGLIGVVAHDLRSPLNRIEGLTHLLQLNPTLNSSDQEIIDIIKKVCNDGNALIRDLLDIHQYEHNEKLILTSVSLTDHLPALISQYASQLDQKDLKLFLEYDAPVMLVTEASYLTRILDNLITNAIKFSPGGKNIYLKLHRQHDVLKIMIQDEGPGFHPDDLPHLFRKFKTLSARPTGGEQSTGLGLSIVKSLTEKIKGSIRVESEWGKGATFIIEVPLVFERIEAVL